MKSHKRWKRILRNLGYKRVETKYGIGICENVYITSWRISYLYQEYIRHSTKIITNNNYVIKKTVSNNIRDVKKYIV